MFPRRLLHDDETIVVELHPHWWYFSAPVALLSVSVAFAVLVLAQTDAESTARSVASWASLALLAVAAMWLVARSTKWLTTAFVITTSRVISRSGWLVKRTVEIPLDRIETITSSQNLFERFVVVGDLTIDSEHTRERFDDIRNPDRIKAVIHGLVSERHDRLSGITPTIDVAAQLERFEGMLDRGTLTLDEFEAQKQRLLDQL